MVSRMTSLKQLPQVVQVGRYKNVLVDVFKDEDVDQVYQLVRNLAAQGQTGMDSATLDSIDSVRRYTKKFGGIVAKDVRNKNKLFLYGTGYASTLCRSMAPVGCGGYLATDHAYRGEKLGADGMRLLFLVANSKGYAHILARFGNNPSFMDSLKMYKSRKTGVINDSYNDGKESHENMVLHIPLNDNPQMKFEHEPELPHLDESKGIPHLNTDLLEGCQDHMLRSVLVSKQLARQDDNVTLDKEDGGFMTCREGNLVLKMARGDTAVSVENMFREAALSGAGIAMDEFNDSGLLNRKRFHESITLTAFTSDDDSLIGGVVLGSSGIALTPSYINLGLYITVDPAYRRRGYGSAIYNLCEKMARSWKFENILTDAFTHDVAGLRLASANNVLPTGHIPYAGWVKGKGYMPSVILHKVI